MPILIHLFIFRLDTFYTVAAVHTVTSVVPADSSCWCCRWPYRDGSCLAFFRSPGLSHSRLRALRVFIALPFAGSAYVCRTPVGGLCICLSHSHWRALRVFVALPFAGSASVVRPLLALFLAEIRPYYFLGCSAFFQSCSCLEFVCLYSCSASLGAVHAWISTVCAAVPSLSGLF